MKTEKHCWWLLQHKPPEPKKQSPVKKPQTVEVKPKVNPRFAGWPALDVDRQQKRFEAEIAKRRMERIAFLEHQIWLRKTRAELKDRQERHLEECRLRASRGLNERIAVAALREFGLQLDGRLAYETLKQIEETVE